MTLHRFGNGKPCNCTESIPVQNITGIWHMKPGIIKHWTAE